MLLMQQLFAILIVCDYYSYTEAKLITQSREQYESTDLTSGLQFEIKLENTSFFQNRAGEEKKPFNFVTKKDYEESIKKLREHFGGGAPDSNGRYVIPGDAAGITRISLEGYGVELVLQNRDIYLVGFIVNNRFFQLSGHSNVMVSVDPSPLPTVCQSNYELLRDQAGRHLSTVQVSTTLLGHQANSLRKYAEARLNSGNPKKEADAEMVTNVAQAIFGFAVAISESIRFIPLFRGILNAVNVNDWTGTFTLGSRAAILLHYWRKLSQFAISLDSDINSPARMFIPGVETQEPNNEINRNNVYKLVGLILFCSAEKPFENQDVLMCSDTEQVTINGVQWSKDDFIIFFY